MNTVRYRFPLAVSAGLAGAALLAACSSSASSPAASTPPAGGGGTSTTAQAAAPSGKTIDAKLTEFHIALSKASLSPGTYTFDVKNAGSITHALTVDGKGVDNKGTDDLSPGQSATFTVTLTAGKYDVFCPVGNHKMEGMDETVQVG